MAWWISVPEVRGIRVLAAQKGTHRMFGMRLRNLRHRRHGLSGYEASHQNLVSSNVAHGGTKKWHERFDLAAGFGLGQLQTAWSMLHKMRLAMVRPSRERLSGSVEVDETYWGAAESGGAVGRLTQSKSLIAVAAQCDGAGIGRIRLGRIPDTSRATLHQFIAESIEPGSTVITDGLNAYRQLEGYHHERLIQRREAPDVHLLPRVHRVVSLLKRWLLGTHQGAVSDAHLNAYLAEFTFRFNRRKSASRGKLFYRLAQQAVQVGPTPFSDILKPQDVGSPESRK